MRPYRLAGVLLAMTLTAATAATAQTPSSDECLDNQLRQLKELHEKELIPEDVYRQQVQELLAKNPAGSPAGGSMDLPDVSGTWRVRVEGLSIWAPRYALDKALGLATWKLATAGDTLSLEAAVSDPAPDAAPSGEAETPVFEVVELRDVILRHDFVAFEVRRSSSAYEAFQLEGFSPDRIEGSYTAYDPYAGGPGSGPEYRGRLILTKVP